MIKARLSVEATKAMAMKAMKATKPSKATLPELRMTEARLSVEASKATLPERCMTEASLSVEARLNVPLLAATAVQVHVQSRARGHVLGPVVASRAVCRRRTGRPIGSLTWCRSGGPSRGPPVHHEIGAATLTTTWSVKRASVCLPIAPTAKCFHRCARGVGVQGAPPGDPLSHTYEPGRSRERHPHRQERPGPPTYEWRVGSFRRRRATPNWAAFPPPSRAREKPTTRGGPEGGWGNRGRPPAEDGEERGEPPTHRGRRHEIPRLPISVPGGASIESNGGSTPGPEGTT